MQKYSVEKFKSRVFNCTYAIYSYQVECYVLFGNKKDMMKACERLNNMK
jgi:hypothetical protein